MEHILPGEINSGASSHSLLYEVIERLLDIESLLGAHQIVWHIALLTAPLLCLLARDQARSFQVRLRQRVGEPAVGIMVLLHRYLIPKDAEDCVVVLARLRLQVELLPPCEVFQRLWVRDIIDEAANIGASVECSEKRCKPLLSS